MEEQLYDVFVRDWWKLDELGRLVPHLGPREYLAHGVSYAEAHEMCREYNDSHDPGPFSRKAEFERE